MQMSSFPKAMRAIQANLAISAINRPESKQSLNPSNLCKWLTTLRDADQLANCIINMGGQSRTSDKSSAIWFDGSSQ